MSGAKVPAWCVELGRIYEPAGGMSLGVQVPREHDKPPLQIPTFKRAERYTFPTLTSVEQCIRTGHKINDVSLETIERMINTVKTLIEIQVKTLEHGRGFVVDT
jgi:hypothetical protein